MPRASARFPDSEAWPTRILREGSTSGAKDITGRWRFPVVGTALLIVAALVVGAIYPWIVPHEAQGQNLDDFPNLKRWFDSIRARPATIEAYRKGEEIRPSDAPMTDEQKKVLFGQTAASVR